MSELPEEEEILRDLLLMIIDTPEDLRIDTVSTRSSVVHDIYLADSDIGQVLGRGGRTADAFRTICGGIYSKAGKRLILQVVDPRRG